MAAELLIPREVVKTVVSELPIVAAVLKRLAKQSHVSELAAALRIANLAPDFGSRKASVVFFEGDTVNWQWSRTLTMPDDTAISLRMGPENAAPNALRHIRKKKGDVIVASLIENPFVLPLCLSSCCRSSMENRSRGTNGVRNLSSTYSTARCPFRGSCKGVLGPSSHELKACLHQRPRTPSGNAMKNVLRESPGSGSRARRVAYLRLRLEEWCER